MSTFTNTNAELTNTNTGLTNATATINNENINTKKNSVIDNDEPFKFDTTLQQYAIVSLRYDEQKIIDSFKTRGVCKTEDQSKKIINDFYKKDLQKLGGVYPNLYVKVGEWNAINLDFNKFSDQQNNIIKANKLAYEYECALKQDRLDELKRQSELEKTKSIVISTGTDEQEPKVVEASTVKKSKNNKNSTNIYNADALENLDGKNENTENNEFCPDKKYLFADAPIKYNVIEQNYYSLSLLSNESFPANYKHMCSDPNIVLLKIKCVYSDLKDGTDKSEYFEKKEPKYDVILADIGKWYDIKYSIDSVETEEGIVYDNKELNDYMSKTKNNKTQHLDDTENIEDIKNIDNVNFEQTNVTNTENKKVVLNEDAILESINNIHLTKEDLEKKLDEKNNEAKFLESRINELTQKFNMLHCK